MDLSSKFDSYRDLFNEYESLNRRLRDIDYFIHEFSHRSKVISVQMVTVNWLDVQPFTFPVPYDVLIPSLKSLRAEISSQIDSLYAFFNSLPCYESNKVSNED